MVVAEVVSEEVTAVVEEVVSVAEAVLVVGEVDSVLEVVPVVVVVPPEVGVLPEVEEVVSLINSSQSRLVHLLTGFQWLSRLPSSPILTYISHRLSAPFPLRPRRCRWSWRFGQEGRCFCYP